MLLRPCFASNLRVMMRRRWEIHMAAHDKEGEEPKGLQVHVVREPRHRTRSLLAMLRMPVC